MDKGPDTTETDSLDSRILDTRIEDSGIFRGKLSEIRETLKCKLSEDQLSAIVDRLWGLGLKAMGLGQLQVAEVIRQLREGAEARYKQETDLLIPKEGIINLPEFQSYGDLATSMMKAYHEKNYILAFRICTHIMTDLAYRAHVRGDQSRRFARRLNKINEFRIEIGEKAGLRPEQINLRNNMYKKPPNEHIMGFVYEVPENIDRICAGDAVNRVFCYYGVLVEEKRKDDRVNIVTGHLYAAKHRYAAIDWVVGQQYCVYLVEPPGVKLEVPEARRRLTELLVGTTAIENSKTLY